MKRKKLTAFMLVTAITASLLAGCGGGSDTGSTGDTGSTEAPGGVKRRILTPQEIQARRSPNFHISSQCRARK